LGCEIPTANSDSGIGARHPHFWGDPQFGDKLRRTHSESPAPALGKHSETTHQGEKSSNQGGEATTGKLDGPPWGASDDPILDLAGHTINVERDNSEIASNHWYSEQDISHKRGTRDQ